MFYPQHMPRIQEATCTCTRQVADAACASRKAPNSDAQEEFLGSVWLLLRTSFWSIFQPPGLLLSQETDKGVHEHRRKKRPEYSCAPNSWEVAREQKNLNYFLSRISLLSSIFLLRVDNWFKAAPTPHARPCTPARPWCKPWADGAVQWKIRSPRKHRAKNKTPSSRKLHGLFQDKKKNWAPWAKIRILLQSGVFHFYELPGSLLIEESSIPHSWRLISFVVFQFIDLLSPGSHVTALCWTNKRG